MKTKICGKCKRKLPLLKFYSNGDRWECEDCSRRYNRLEKWNIPFDVESKYISRCKRCGCYITKLEYEDNRGICDICTYEDEANSEWSFLNEH